MKPFVTSVVLALLGAGATLQNFESFPIGSTTVGYTVDGVAVAVKDTHVADINGPASFKDRSLSTLDPTCPCAPRMPTVVTFTPPVSMVAVSMTTSTGYANVLPAVQCVSTDGNNWTFGLKYETTGSWPHTRARSGSAGFAPDPSDTSGPKISECSFVDGDFDNLYTTP